MKFLRPSLRTSLGPGIALVVVGASLAALPMLNAQAAPPGANGDTLVAQMRSEADGSTKVSTNPATGKVGFIRAGQNGDLLPDVNGRKDPLAKADAYLDKYAGAFGSTRGQLHQTRQTRDDLGTTVTYKQVYKGLDVWGSAIVVHLDAQGDLTSVNGVAAPGLSLGTTPRFDQAAAEAAALRTVRANPPGAKADADLTGITATATTDKPLVYRHGLVNGQPGKAELAWQVEVTNKLNVRDMVFISGATGKPVNRYSMIHDALDRVLYEADEDRNLTEVWAEGDPLPGTLNEDQESMVRSTGDAYWFFMNAFGRDSYDGEGATMFTVNNDPIIECPNANWNGVSTNYCDGVSGDDTVAHEWGHAYTEYTDGLIYQWQSGALNESYSDMWGETVDLLNARGDDAFDSVPREDGKCSSFTRGNIGMTINAPAEIAKDCESAAASFGPVFTKAGITTDLVVGTDVDEDGADPASTTTDGCSPLTNAAAVAGKFVYVDRGVCTFATKAANAVDAGATGIVVGDSVADRAPISMSGAEDIYGLMITKADGDLIKGATGAISVTVKDIDEDAKTESKRWLSGEDDPAFGGAIRDMWNPNCYGDPGKVSDAQYFCDTDDQGGVHSNSGVPNHGYALLVDGGDYNGVTVPKIGLTKAAHVYYRAMTNYQTPTSGFADHADALAAACTDLIGADLNALRVAANDSVVSPEKISAADCAAVNAMAQAVELRLDPVQCNFRPLLKRGTASLCDDTERQVKAWSEDFESGTDGWTITDDSPFWEGEESLSWQLTGDLPDRAGHGVFGPDQATLGDCSGEAPGDISGHTMLTSPEITVPEALAASVSFRHSVITEGGWDGGNVKIAVNGGAFELVPEDAFLHNPYNALLETEAAGNTSPLAGEPAFTGTDGGKLEGRWGQSVIDLSMVDVAAGDKIAVQFDLGRDGCNGVQGWYVDDVQLELCKAAMISSTTKAVAKPKKIAKSGTSKVTVTVKAGNTAATGKVKIMLKKKVLATGTLVNGKVTLKVKGKKLKVGKNSLVAAYLGTADVSGSSKTFQIKVKKAKKRR